MKVKNSPKLDVLADGVTLGKGSVTIKMRKAALRIITVRPNPDPQETVEAPIPQPVSKNHGKNHREKSVIVPG